MSIWTSFPLHYSIPVLHRALEQMPAPTTLPRLCYGHHPWSHSECGNDSTVPTHYLDGHTDAEEETVLLLYMLSQQRYLHAYPKKFPSRTFKLSVAYLNCYFKMSKKLWIIPLRAATYGWAGCGLYKNTWPTEAVSIQRKGAFQILHRGSVCPRSSHACIIFTALSEQEFVYKPLCVHFWLHYFSTLKSCFFQLQILLLYRVSRTSPCSLGSLEK